MDKRRFPVCAQFIDTYFPTIDGVVHTVHNYAKTINGESYCCVVAPHQIGENDEELPYDVIRAKSAQLFLKEYRLPQTIFAEDMKKALNQHDFELFHVHSPALMGKFALREARRRHIPVVATFHSKYYDDILKITHSKAIARTAVRQILSFYDKCDSVWAVSEATADTLRGYGFTGDIYVTGNGTDYTYPDNAAKMAQDARTRLDIDADTPILLFVGHQIWQKNLKLVLDTMACLKRDGVRFKTVIAGSGYAENEIRAYADSLDLNDCVTFTGQISQKEQLQALELAASLFFFPSVYDNAPLVVREAATMRLPAMLMRGSNAAENTVDGENAFHCTDDAESTAARIRALLDNPALLRQVGENAAQTLGKPWREIMPSVREKYNEIIDAYK